MYSTAIAFYQKSISHGKHFALYGMLLGLYIQLYAKLQLIIFIL